VEWCPPSEWNRCPRSLEYAGSGGKVRLGNISKRGDTYMRTLLIHGARSVLHHAKDPGPWLAQIKERRPANVAIVAQAAKMVRTIWAVTAKETDYQRALREPGRLRRDEQRATYSLTNQPIERIWSVFVG
jgi:glycerophosphoryl diester phosphodiesterase